MQLTLRTTDKPPVDATIGAEPTQTVDGLSAEIAATLGVAVKALVFSGKLLKDGSTSLASLGVADGGLLVVMVGVVKAKKKAKAATPAPAPPVAAAAAPPATAVAPATPAAATNAAALAQLVALGIADSERTAARAMEMAGGEIERAAELLASGMLAGAGAPAAAAPTAAPDVLAELAALPALAQMRAQVAADPQLLRPLLQQLGQTHPDVLAQIAENPGAFVRELTAPVAATDRQRYAPHGGVPRVDPAAAQQAQVNLTAEDENALQSLSEYGRFSREQLIEAYLACGKNLEQAGSFLFDQIS